MRGATRPISAMKIWKSPEKKRSAFLPQVHSGNENSRVIIESPLRRGENGDGAFAVDPPSPSAAHCWSDRGEVGH